MKTAFIFDDGEGVKLVTVEGDQRRFENVFINSSFNEKLEDELTELFYGRDGVFKFEKLTTVQFADAVRAGAFVVVAGFLP